MKYPARLLIPVLMVILACSSCECEERVRKMISNPGDRKANVHKAQERRRVSKSSAPRESEPNDFPKQATLFKLGGDLRPVEAAIDHAGDNDWYALTSRNGETWQIEMTVTPADDGLDAVIRVAVPGSEDAPTTYNLAGAGEPESIPILSVGSVPQRVVVAAHAQTSGAYEVSFQKRLSGGSVEAEPNDDIDAASRFEAPGEVQGFYDRPGDRDIYFVPRKGLDGAVFSLEVSPVDELVQQVRVFVHRSFESPYLSLQVSPTRAASVPNLALPEDVLGVWVVLTSGESFNRDNSYRLQLLAHPPSNDALEAEPNDAVESAQKIELGARLVGYFHAPEDVDHLRLYVDGIPDDEAAQDATDAGAPRLRRDSDTDQAQADAGSDVEAIAQADASDAGAAEPRPDPLEAVADKTPAEHVVRVTLTPTRDKSRLAIAWANAPGEDASTVIESEEAGHPVTLCNRVVEHGFLDLEVRSLASPEEPAQPGYDYVLAAEDVGDQPGLEIEPNDARDAADKLMGDRGRIGYVARAGDVDVYAFSVPHPEPAADGPDTGPTAAKAIPTPRGVKLGLGAHPLNLEFKLVDDEGGLVAEVNRAGAGGPERLAIDLPPGLYFVHVSAKQGFACKPYTIDVNVDE